MGSSSSTDSVSFDYDRALLLDPNEKQSAPVQLEEENKQPANRGAIHRNVRSMNELKTVPFPGVDSIWKAWTRGVGVNKDGKCLGSRVFTLNDGKYVRSAGKNALPERGDYVYMSYGEVDTMARDFGAGLVSLGLKARDAVGIYAINRAEWSVANLGNFSQNFRTVALYDTLGAEAAEYIVEHAECGALVLSKDKLSKVLEICKKVKCVKVIVQFDVIPSLSNVEETLDDADVKKAEELGIKLLSFSELLKVGKAANIFPTEPVSDDLAYIMYTSGTTGMPKGVMLSHGNIMATIAAAMEIFALNEKDIHVSYLPLAHIFESCVQSAMFLVGGQVNFFQGDPRKLPDDFAASKVTILCGVPRVFEKIYDRVQGNVGTMNCFSKWLVTKSLNDGYENIRKRIPSDSGVLRTIRDKIGLQNVRVIVTGAAPMAAYLAEFLRCVIGAPVCQGYGMTESAAASTLCNPSDYNSGHVGPPCVDVEICLEDVPDMNYLHTDTITLATGEKIAAPRGEILLRGPAVFKGYYKNEQATAETLEDGWLHTGDVGRWNPNGTLSVIDRKKNMMKLSQGEYVALEKVEASYKTTWCNQFWLYGNSYHSKLLAVVVPYPEVVVPWLVQKGWWPSGMAVKPTPEFLAEFKSCCEAHYAELKAEIMLKLEAAGKSNGVKGFEKVCAIHMELEMDSMFMGFTMDNDCITPTQKMKRNVLVKKYEKVLREMYSAVEEPCKPGEVW